MKLWRRPCTYYGPVLASYTPPFHLTEVNSSQHTEMYRIGTVLACTPDVDVVVPASPRLLLQCELDCRVRCCPASARRTALQPRRERTARVL